MMGRVAVVLVFGAAACGLAWALLDGGVVRLNHPSLARYPVRGIDVSHHQGTIDWSAIAGQGISFAFIKATEGQDFSDPRFAVNWDGCLDAGLACGAYHFLSFCSPGRAQARHFLRTVDLRTAHLPPVVDVEFSGNCRNHPTCGDIARELRTFVDEIERAHGRRPLIYVAGSAHRRVVRPGFADYPLWKRNVFFEPPGACRTWTFWQFANRGRLDGIDGFVDLNVFCGNRQAFTGRYGR